MREVWFKELCTREEGNVNRWHQGPGVGVVRVKGETLFFVSWRDSLGDLSVVWQDQYQIS